jgi:hypothetical protein
MTKKTAAPKTEFITCPRCDGAGHFRAYAGIAGGVCFQCNGAKVIERRIKSEATLKREAANREKVKAAREAKMLKYRVDSDRRIAMALRLYKDDPRLWAHPGQGWYADHVQALAKRDRLWYAL